MGCKYTDNFEELGADVVYRMGISHRGSMDRPATVIDCRAFGRRTGDWKLVHHCGEHYETLHMILDHEYMKEMLEEVKATILICRQHGVSLATILMLCTTGTHKSVSAARLAKEGFELSGCETAITHMCKANWAPRKKCSTCNFCKVGCEWKLPMFEQCKEMLAKI